MPLDHLSREKNNNEINIHFVQNASLRYLCMCMPLPLLLESLFPVIAVVEGFGTGSWSCYFYYCIMLYHLIRFVRLPYYTPFLRGLN